LPRLQGDGKPEKGVKALAGGKGFAKDGVEYKCVVVLLLGVLLVVCMCQPLSACFPADVPPPCTSATLPPPPPLPACLPACLHVTDFLPLHCSLAATPLPACL
jgi:hypothetical protein